jgi:hypothetical protein
MGHLNGLIFIFKEGVATFSMSILVNSASISIGLIFILLADEA